MRQQTITLALLLLILSSLSTIAAEATLNDVNRALASTEPVVLIGVPDAFLHPDTIEGDAAETQDDWAHYLNQWTEASAKKNKLKVIVVPLGVLAGALQTPALKDKDCATLFVKNKIEGLLFDQYCVPQIEEYELGTKWLQGAATPHEIAKIGFKTTAVVARVRK
jgi:hypothetical protein